MRIAVVNWSRRKAGGTETYLSLIIPALVNAGHEVAFWYEIDKPVNREQIALPDGVPVWCAATMGERRALDALRDWRPDLIYTHKLQTPRLEAETLKIAPAVFFAHDYYGTCISGAKTFKRPEIMPCSRRFGLKCLLHYFPHRCGGLSPVTMFRLFHLQSQRLKLLDEYRAVLTHSSHMYNEYIKHGLSPDRVHNLSYYAQGTGKLSVETEVERRTDSSLPDSDPHGFDVQNKPYYHLLFLGRMELLKGGRTFIDALPQIRRELKRPLRVTFAGDGPDRAAWERKALKAGRRDAELRIDFIGWVPRAELDALYEDCDVLVFPSLWPEPFGLVGPEAGLHGIPVAAFNVGGVSDWLTDGINGHLAPGDPPTASGLARAVVKCLQNYSAYANLQRGAIRAAHQFNLENHLAALTSVFTGVVSP